MTQEVLKKMYQLLLTEPHAPNVCVQLERIAREALAEHAMQQVQRLGQEIEQEPVAWMDADGNVSDNNDHKCFPIPLYTHPPQRTWVNLTDDEIDRVTDAQWGKNVNKPIYAAHRAYARAVEAASKEKNT